MRSSRDWFGQNGACLGDSRLCVVIHTPILAKEMGQAQLNGRRGPEANAV